MKRVEANDPTALSQMACVKKQEGDYKSAVEYLTRAIALGDVEAHFGFSFLYADGLGVKRDKKKDIYHLEQAAIGGHASARFNLGCAEKDRGRLDRAVKHWIIAAKQGDNDSMQALKKCL